MISTPFEYSRATSLDDALAKLRETKGEGKFITEVSMDETDSPQTPVELLVILVALADEKVPIQTVLRRRTSFCKSRSHSS